MTSKPKAVVQALVDALTSSRSAVEFREDHMRANDLRPCGSALRNIDAALTAGRALISQMKQEPAAAQGEPVAWIRPEDLSKLKELGANADVALLAYKAMAFTTPLYAAPPSPQVRTEADARPTADGVKGPEHG